MTKNTNFNKITILKKVLQLFDDKGYCATSMQDIVDTTKLNRSSIYNTFGSKLDFFVACFNTSESIYRRHIQQIILNETSPLKALRRIFELSMNKTVEGYVIPNYISEAKNDEPLIQGLLISQNEYILELFVDIVKRGQNLGVINNSKSINQYATYLLSSYYGIQTMKIFPIKNLKLENTVYDILSVLE